MGFAVLPADLGFGGSVTRFTRGEVGSRATVPLYSSSSEEKEGGSRGGDGEHSGQRGWAARLLAKNAQGENVCVCERERERESVCVCVCVFVLMRLKKMSRQMR